jgi:hypothetical protein
VDRLRLYSLHWRRLAQLNLRAGQAAPHGCFRRVWAHWGRMPAPQGNGPDHGVEVHGRTYTWSKVGANISSPRPQTLADLNTLVFDIPSLQVRPRPRMHSHQLPTARRATEMNKTIARRPVDARPFFPPQHKVDRRDVLPSVSLRDFWSGARDDQRRRVARTFSRDRRRTRMFTTSTRTQCHRARTSDARTGGASSRRWARCRPSPSLRRVMSPLSRCSSRSHHPVEAGPHPLSAHPQLSGDREPPLSESGLRSGLVVSEVGFGGDAPPGFGHSQALRGIGATPWLVKNHV